MPENTSRGKTSKSAESTTGTRSASFLDLKISGLTAAVERRVLRKE